MALTIPYYTVDDLDRFPDDGNRYELLDGVLLVTPLASQTHQLIASRLIVALTNAASASSEVRVTGPGVVLNPPRTQLEPDVLVFPARFPARSKWVDISEHLLAVEIFSPSSRVYDREFKRDAYLWLGVQEVWLVDAEALCVEVSRPREAVEIVRDVVRWRIPNASVVVDIDLGEIFDGLE